METQPSEQPDWLAQTKLHPPLLRWDLISRPHLVESLHRALALHPLTLLSAPAGYGKTTLLASLRQGDGEMGGQGDGLPLSPSPWPGSRWTRRTTTRPAS